MFSNKSCWKKGSSHIPWEKFNTPLKSKEGSWQTYAPSSIKRSKFWPKPLELTLKKIMEIKKLFINSAKLANKAGFEILEIHMAHGYLLHQFFLQYLILEMTSMEEVYKKDQDFY